MAKLYGTADPVLVSAAFKHGESNIPMDLSSVYAKREKTMKGFGTAVSAAFDSIYADNKKTMDLLADNCEKALNIMEAGDIPNPWGMKMHNDIVSDYKSKLKAINSEYGKGKGGDLKRSELRAEMNRYLSNLEKSSGMFENMVANGANSRLLKDLGDDRAKLFNLILEDHNNGTSLTKSEYKDGDIVYTLPGSDVQLSMREINEGMSTHDPKYLTTINAKLTGFMAKGKAMGGTMTEDDALRFKNDLQKSITNWDEIRNVSQEKFGNMKFSFEEVLTGQAKDPITGAIDTSLISNIYEELEALGGIDIDDDGDIDETDKGLLAQAKAKGEIYTDPKNGFHLIDALKKDKQKYRDVMANYLTETAVKDFYGQGAAQFKGKKGTGPTNNPYGKGGVIPGFNSGGWQTGETLQKRRNQAENNYPFTGVAGKYKPAGNGMWILNDDKENPMSTYSVFDQEGLIQSGDTPEQYGTQQEIEQDFTTSNIDIFKNSNQSSAINKINELYDFDSAGMKLIKPPATSLIGSMFARFFNIRNKGNMLVVQGPSGGFYDFDAFDKNGELLEYGGKTGVKPPKGTQPLTFNLNENHNTAEDMLKKLQKLVGLAGVNENTPTPMTPIVGESAGTADNF